MLLNVLLAGGVGLAVQLWPVPPPPPAASAPIRLEMTREPEPEPELTALASRPKPTPPPYLRTEERQRQDKPPEDALFQSDKDTANASEAPPSGDAPLASQEGRVLPTMEFDTREYVAGDKAVDDAGQGPVPAPAVAQQQPQPPPAPQTPRLTEPPRPQVNREAPRPTPAPAPTPARPEPNEFAMLAPTPTPPPPAPSPTPSVSARETTPPRPQPAPPLETARAQPRPPTPPVTQPGAPGYRPQTIKTRIEGNIGTRGPSSIAALGTPLGRYQKAISDAIGSRWYFGIQQNADTVQIGSVKVSFVVDRDGKVLRPRVIQGSSGSTLATVSVTAIIDANLPPIPPEVVATLDGGQLDITYTFTNL